MGIVSFAENINESLKILCIKWRNDKIKNVVNIRHIIFEEQSDLGNSMFFLVCSISRSDFISLRSRYKY